jgi:hypothetical protein
MGQKIFSVILILGLAAWIMALASVTGCYTQEQLDDNYSCEETCDNNTDFPY